MSTDRQAEPPAPKSRASETRCAVVGVIGRTNTGKSTLVNQLVGEKISIVSPTVQTTRNTVRGILTERRGQLVLVDTPGLHKAESQLGTLINRMARQAAATVDVLLLVVDVSHPPQLEDDGWLRRLLFAEQPCLVLLNKSDRSEDHEPEYRDLWERIQEEKQQRRKLMWLRGSAATGAGLASLVGELFALAKPGPLLFDRDTVTDYPRRLAIADVIREKFLDKLRDELPHELGVRVDQIHENGANWHIEAVVFVNRPSQKPIVIGPKGRTLRHVKRTAEPEIGSLFDVTVTLDIWIKVEKNWMKNFWLLKQMGYAGER